MCGIAGFYGSGDEKILKKMTRSLAHRGPDDEGFYISQNIGLGHRRLSIIDLKSGHQPMSNEDETVRIVFNGEIYNFQALKKDLEQKGHKFRTSSDTETILHLYEQEGENCVKKLRGMFAFAIWDARKNQLFLARDRMGKKPLYYGIFNNTFIFGSEVKALLEHPIAKKEINSLSLQKFLVYEYVPTPDTMFKNIWKLPAGHSALWKNNNLKISQYWELNLREEKISENEAIEKLDHLLDEAVKIRLISDVPLGVFLSGGLDSSTIAYYAAKHKKNLQTFSIGFDESSFDESRYAKTVSKYLGTNHNEMIVRSNDVLELIEKLPEIQDDPVADASIFPTYILSKFTRQSVTVSLSGDGGDELFFGYPTFQAHKAAEIYLRLPKAIQNAIRAVIHNLPVSHRNFSFDFVVKKFTQGMHKNPGIRNQLWLGAFQPNELDEILTDEVKNGIKNELIFQNIFQEQGKLSQYPPLQQVDYFYLKHYLCDDILNKVDRASMAASLEVRSPFLDQGIVNFAASLPISLKLKGFTTKYILKKLMQKYLPKNIVYRKKKGFGVPLSHWFMNELYEKTKELFQTPDPFFKTDALLKLLEEHKEKKYDHRKKLFTILILKLWLNKWLCR